MNSNIRIVREAYRLITGATSDPLLLPSADIPADAYNFTPLSHDDLRVDLKIKMTRGEDFVRHSAQLRIFQPGVGQGTWPGRIVATCNAIDGVDSCSGLQVIYGRVVNEDFAGFALLWKVDELLSSALVRAHHSCVNS